MTRVVLCVQNMGIPEDPRVWTEARSLHRAGYDVTVIAPRLRNAASSEELEGIPVVRYRCRTGGVGIVGQLIEVGSGFVGTLGALVRMRRVGPIDVLHVANPPDTLFPLAWWLRRCGTRFVFDQHDAAPELLVAKLGRHPVLRRALDRLERATFAAADLVIVSNNSLRRRALGRSGLQPNQVVTVRLGPAAPPARGWVPPEIPTVAYAGVMGTQDTVEVLVDAFALVRRNHPQQPARLVLVGDGDGVSSLRTRIARLGIGHDVHWTGWLPRAEVLEHLARATVGVSPDVDDPYTQLCTMIKVSEYLTAGMPTIVADLPENRATAGDAAVYFRPGDASDLAARLSEMLFDPTAIRRMADAAAARAPELSWARSEPRLLAAYRHLLDDAPAVEGDQHVEPARITKGS